MGFGRRVVTVTDVNEVQPGYVLESFNIASCGNLKKVASINTSEFVGLVDTNVSLLPEKTGLSYNVHPTYIMHPHNIVHIGYASIEYKTIVDLYFEVREHVKIFNIDFTGEVLQKFIKDSQNYIIPSHEVFRSSANKEPRFENPQYIFGRPSGINLNDTDDIIAASDIPAITDTLKYMINFKKNGIFFDEIEALEMLVKPVSGFGRLLNEIATNSKQYVPMQGVLSKKRIFDADYKEFLINIPGDITRDMTTPNFISFESEFDEDTRLYNHLMVVDEPLIFAPKNKPVVLVYTRDGYCVGLLDEKGRLFNRGGFYVTTVKTNKNK